MTRLILTTALAALVACNVDQSKFESTYRAAKALQAGVDANVDIVRYAELVQALSTEVTLLRDRVSGAPEEKLLSMYEDALKPYNDALVIWQHDPQRQTDVIHRGPIMDKVLEPYDVKFQNGTAPAEATMRRLWKIGAVRLDSANSQLLGR